MREKIIITAVAFGIFFLAAFFRFYGGNWDQNQHLHPDERFLTMVANGITWPNSFAEYLDTQNSPLNPHNRGFGFFVYGTFPVFFTKWVAENLKLGDYNNLTLVGRQLSALFDLGTVILVFLIAKEIKTPQGWQISAKDTSGVTRRGSPDGGESKKTNGVIIGLFAAFFYAASVLPIQLSHFYAVDTYLCFFSILSLYITIRILTLQTDRKFYLLFLFFLAIVLGISLGLAVACKISGVLVLPAIGLGLIYFLLKDKHCLAFIVTLFLFALFSYLTFRIAQPYAFAPSNLFSTSFNTKFINNMKELKAMDNDKAMFPPAIQWRDRLRFLFPLNSIILGGMGLPLSPIIIISFFFITAKVITNHLKVITLAFKKRKLPLIKISDKILSVLILFALTVFIYQGSLYTMNMRYFVPIYPALSIIGSFALGLFLLNYLLPKVPIKTTIIFIAILFILLMFWPLSFMAIYQKPHSRVLASRWIYENIPPGTTLSYEHWDDPLPLHLPDGLIPNRYRFVEMELYVPDVYDKWKKVAANLEKTDYIIMSSNRLWGSIPRVPEIYPLSSEYYKKLFDGSLGFEKVAEITSSPCFPSAKFCLFTIDDSTAEESFTVYDHPKVLIYKKVSLNRQLLQNWLERSRDVKL